MNCYQHPDVSATAFCRSCGRALCAVCQYPAEGTVFCAEHNPVAPFVTSYAPPYAPPVGYPGTASFGPDAPFVTPPPGSAVPNPYTSPIPPPPAAGVHASPGLAFLLGLIPGVGAIYNGQYVKGLLHAVVFGLLASISGSTEHTGGATFFGILTAAFYFYMPFEAYHTARKRQLGLPLDEWSSLIATSRFGSHIAIGPALLIVLGILFLLDSLNVLPLSQLGRFWPVLLILIGVVMLYARISPRTRGREEFDGK